MCKAHVLMQSSPFRWEESKPIVLFFNSSLAHRKYTFSQIICLFEALREVISVTISFFPKMLFCVIVCTWLFSHGTFFEKQMFSQIMHVLRLDSYIATVLSLNLPMIFYKIPSFYYYYIFYFLNEELSLIQRVVEVLYFFF